MLWNFYCILKESGKQRKYSGKMNLLRLDVKKKKKKVVYKKKGDIVLSIGKFPLHFVLKEFEENKRPTQ